MLLQSGANSPNRFISGPQRKGKKYREDASSINNRKGTSRDEESSISGIRENRVILQRERKREREREKEREKRN